MQQMKTIARTKSLITNSDNIEPLFEMKHFPVFIGATSQSIEADVFADMEWMICRDSGIIQLKNLLPLEVVYSEYHSEAVGGIWNRHHLLFCDFISKFSPENVLEIGGSNGFIASTYIEKHPKLNWTIIEPTPKFTSNDNIKVIQAFFSDKIEKGDIDTVVHSHTLEHMYNPDEFIKQIASFLSFGEKHIFSIPNLYKYLCNKFTNAINFEHTYLLTEYFMDYLLAANGFKIISKEYFEDHSIFYATEKQIDVVAITLINQYYNYKMLFNDYIHFYKEEVSRLNNIINLSTADIYLFGAHVFSQFLIYCGLKTDKIIKIIDNSQAKLNKRLYGTELFIDKPIVIKASKEPIVILKAGCYQDEVRKQLFSINTQVIIVE
jgi:hypothetical protein